MANITYTNGISILPSEGDIGSLFSDLTVTSATAGSMVMENAFGKITLTAAAAGQFGGITNGVPTTGMIASAKVEVWTVPGTLATLFTVAFPGTTANNPPIALNTVLSNYGYGLNFASSGLFGQADVVTGSASNDYIKGSYDYFYGSNYNYGNDTINGAGGDDTIDGGYGTDSMSGGAGDDVFIISETTDVVVEAAASGIDTVVLPYGGTFTLPANVENGEVGPAWFVANAYGSGTLTGNALNNILRGGESSDSLAGGAGIDRLFGAGGNDTLNGGTGADIMSGGYGNDTYFVDAAGDKIYENTLTSDYYGLDTVNSTVNWTLGANLENLTLAGNAAINGTGNTLNNLIIGNAGNNVINGGAGIDTLSYETALAKVTVSLSSAVAQATGGGGTDTVTQFENLIGGAAGDALTGSALANRIDGRGGADTMVGGAGNDTYVVDVAGDVITEAAGAGIDTVESAVTRSLVGTNLENLTLTGFAVINGTGNDVANVIIGNLQANLLVGGAGNDTLQGESTAYSGTGNDTLDGGTGADSMNGGAGNDTYYVDNAGDIVVDTADYAPYTVYLNTVIASIDYVLPDNIDNLVMIGGAAGGNAVIGAGNSLDNVITANSLGNVLNGGAGIDTLSYAGTAGAVTVSLALTGAQATGGSGSDALRNFENLTGGNGNDSLTGDAGNNVLDGGAGVDQMAGGDGNDTYWVDSGSDVVTENAGRGMDQVFTTVAYTLAPEVEALYLAGAVAISGTGNGLDNLMVGNVANNTLVGGAGNDTLNGSAVSDPLGLDTLDGGDGNDTYLVNSAFGDTILDSSGTDRVIVDGDAAYYQTYTLAASIENLELMSTYSNNSINGVGNAGANIITGSIGVNNIDGAGGNDTLSGGAANDNLTGGAGADVFRFDTPLFAYTYYSVTSNGIDTITDFSPVDDTIALDDDVFPGLPVTAAGTFLDAQFFAGVAAHDADDRIIYNGTTGALFYDPDGNGAQAAIQFATLSTHPTLTAADFVII